jgi:cytochrome c-type biogenesis protein
MLSVNMDITIPIAFLAGVLSFLSPCVLPLVLPYISYISGVSISALKGGEIKGSERIRVILSTLYFILGFSVVFITFGVVAGQIGGVLVNIKEWIGRIGGVIIIILGLHMVGIIRIPFLDYEKRADMSNLKGGYLVSLLIGMAFAFGWTPCIGPILGGIIGITIYEGNPILGAVLLGTYSLGLGLPFFLTSIFINVFVKLISKFKNAVRITEIVGGIIIILLGIILISSSISIISSFIIKVFPFLATFG